MATIYGRILNGYKFKNHIIFSASFYMIIEEDQNIDESEVFNILKINQISTEIDVENIDVKSQLKHQKQIQETKDSGWIFDKINSMKIRFYRETGELKGSRYAKVR